MFPKLNWVLMLLLLLPVEAVALAKVVAKQGAQIGPPVRLAFSRCLRFESRGKLAA